MFSKVATILVAASAFSLQAYAAPTVEARQEIFAGDGTNFLRPLYHRLIVYGVTGTFYAPGLGACGITNTEAELVVAGQSYNRHCLIAPSIAKYLHAFVPHSISSLI